MNKSTHLPDPKISFLVTLSNGEKVIENRGDYRWIDGQPSPWNRLITYVAKNKLSISWLGLVTEDGQVYNLPMSGGKSRFAEFNKPDSIKPNYYEVKRFLARDMDVVAENRRANIQDVRVVEFYTIAEAIYTGFTVQLWVDEIHPKRSYTVVKNNEK